MISLEQFQCVVARSDPRAVLVFTAPFQEIFPHIVTLSHSMKSAVVTIPDEGDMATLFRDALDEGHWLVVRSMVSVSFDEWRDVGTALATVLPVRSFHSRKNFRLFTFLPSSGNAANVRLYAPQILCQYVAVVDKDGNVERRADLSPVFHAGTQFDLNDGVAALTSTAPQNGRQDPYQVQSALRQRVAEALEAKPPATNIDYVDEVLCSLREELEERQKELLASIERRVEEDLRSVAAAQSANEEASDPFSSDPASRESSAVLKAKELELRKQITAEVEQNYEWVYPRIIEWTICQCPDTDVVGVNQIPAEELEVESVAWKTALETCSTAIWGGCTVLVKKAAPSLATSFTIAVRSLFSKEAARHFPLRHPRIVLMLGMSGDDIVLEGGLGTLEQLINKMRGQMKRLSLRHLLSIIRHVLEGLAFLSTRLVHRDVACRSVVQVSEGEFKIGQFACAIPKGSSDTRDGLVPIRWTAPEGIIGLFTEKSDVWSFGVLCWEMITYCSALPYDEHVQPASHIAKGGTMPMPPTCSRLFWDEIVHPCFGVDPDSRPSAKQLLAKVERAISRWDPQLLDATIPFLDERTTFDEHNRHHL